MDKEYHITYGKEYYKKNRKILLKKAKEYRLRNPQKIKEIHRIYQEKHKEKIAEYQKKHRLKYYKKKRRKKIIKPKNSNRYLKSGNKPTRKYSENQRISMRLRTLVNKAMNRYIETGEFQNAIKYPVNYKSIIEYLKPIPINRTDYHIDHIKPLKLFDLSKKCEMRKAFAPKNHQWLLKKDNWSKAGKF